MSSLQYFTHAEFNCNCGECGVTGKLMDRDFLRTLDEARDIAGVAFKITSGARCAAHNAKVGGSPNSSHLRFVAADIAATTSRQRFLILDALLRAGFKRIGIAETFIHVDGDKEKPDRLTWLYG